MSTQNPEDRLEDMRDEYGFSTGVRGKHHRAYRAGHSVQIRQSDGSIEEHHFTLAEGAVMIDPDLRSQFPNSDAVNQALRSIVSRD